MSQSGYEQGKDVIVHDDRKPWLYDAKDRPLVRAVGFRPRDGARPQNDDKDA